MANSEWQILLAHPLSDLADRWMDDWQDYLRQAGTDLFTPVRVLVPNRNLKRWLQMHVSRRGVVAANLRFQYLEDGIRTLLEEIDPHRGKSFLIRSTELQSRILIHLSEDLEKSSAGSGGTRQYEHLLGPDRSNSREQRLRLYQVSSRLASLFQNYEYHRPRSMEEWRGVGEGSLDIFGDSVFDPGVENTPVCREQRSLYRSVMLDLSSDQGSRDNRPERLPIAEYARRLLTAIDTKVPVDRLRPRRPVYLFGLSFLSRAHISILSGISDYYDVRLYLPDLTPDFFVPAGTSALLKEEWEEVLPCIDSEERIGGARAWSMPAKDTLRLFERASRGRLRWFQRRPSESNHSLAWMHDRLRIASSTGRNEGSFEEDAAEPTHPGLSVLSCPGEWREIETVYQSLLHKMKEDATLRLTDIALLVTDMEYYRPYILHVFEREIGPDGRPLVPYNLSDYSADGESRYAAGVRALLELLDGSLTRSRVFPLFYNPCFLTRRRINRETVREWLSLVDDVRIYRFFDGSDRAVQTGLDENSSPFERSDAFTWLRGLRRLYLGLLANQEPVAGLQPHPLLVIDRVALLQLIETIDVLHQRLEEWKRGESWSGKERLAFLVAFIDDFLSPPPDEREEEKIAGAFRQALSAFDPAIFRDEIFLREAALSSLAGIDGGRGHYLTGGVTICSLQPMRPVPFRHIYVAGLGEGRFPPREERSSLDLLYMDRQRRERSNLPTGDSGVAEKARVLFLETLLSATDEVMLLYNGRDTNRDRELLPSSPLQELLSLLDLKKSVATVPLKLYSRRYLDPERPPGRGLANLSAFDLTLSHIAAGARTGRSSGKGNPSPIVGLLPEEEVGPIDITLAELVQFLRHPLEAVIRRRLGISDSELRDASMEDDEPIHPAIRDVYDFDREVETAVLDVLMTESGADLRASLARIVSETSARFSIGDRMPPPPFDRIQIREWLQDENSFAFRNAEALLRSYPFRHACLQIGGIPGRPSSTAALELTVSLEGRPRHVRITGEIPFLCMNGPTPAESSAVGLLILADESVTNARMIAPVLGLLAMSCLPVPWGLSEAQSASLLVARNKDPENPRNLRTRDLLLAIQSMNGREYLGELAAQYLSGDVDYLSAAMLEEQGLWKDLLNQSDETIARRLTDGMANREERMQLLQVIDPVFSPEAVAKVRRRWTPLVRILREARERQALHG